MQIKLENGLELLIQPVSQPALDDLIDDLGGYAEQARVAEMNDAERATYFRELPYATLDKYIHTLRCQAMYCLGFGVVTDPPPEAVALLQHLDKDSDLPQIRRAHWLLYVAGMTRVDKSNIIGSVMALTRLNDGG